MNYADKVMDPGRLLIWRSQMREQGKKLVVTNGCFDLLHAGHVQYLASARKAGDCLLVGLNGDQSVKALKGPTRPINPEQDRALVLAGLASVDAVCIFPEKRATRFLNSVCPDVYVKGGDYTLQSLDAEEREAVQQHGGQIIFIPFLQGRSTSELIRRMG